MIFFVFPMLRLHKRKPHTYTLMLIFSQVSDFIFKQFLHKQPSIDVLTKWCLENMQQVYRRTPMPKFDFDKVSTTRHRCCPVNLLHIFRTPFPKNSSVATKYQASKAVVQRCTIKEVFLKVL